jgi:hypothetical protein
MNQENGCAEERHFCEYVKRSYHLPTSELEMISLREENGAQASSTYQVSALLRIDEYPRLHEIAS